MCFLRHPVGHWDTETLERKDTGKLGNQDTTTSGHWDKRHRITEIIYGALVRVPTFRNAVVIFSSTTLPFK